MVEYLLDVDDVEEEEVKWDEGFRMTIVCFFLPKVSLNARVRCPSLSASLIFVNASLDGETCSLTVPCCVPVQCLSLLLWMYRWSCSGRSDFLSTSRPDSHSQPTRAQNHCYALIINDTSVVVVTQSLWTCDSDQWCVLSAGKVSWCGVAQAVSSSSVYSKTSVRQSSTPACSSTALAGVVSLRYRL